MGHALSLSKGTIALPGENLRIAFSLAFIRVHWRLKPALRRREGQTLAR